MCVVIQLKRSKNTRTTFVTQTDIVINLMTRGCRSTTSSASRRETADDDTCDNAKYNMFKPFLLKLQKLVQTTTHRNTKNIFSLSLKLQNQQQNQKIKRKIFLMIII